MLQISSKALKYLVLQRNRFSDLLWSTKCEFKITVHGKNCLCCCCYWLFFVFKSKKSKKRNPYSYRVKIAKNDSKTKLLRIYWCIYQNFMKIRDAYFSDKLYHTRLGQDKFTGIAKLHAEMHHAMLLLVINFITYFEVKMKYAVVMHKFNSFTNLSHKHNARFFC